MATVSKRMRAIRAKVDRTKQYSAKEAFNSLKEFASKKFNESVDVAVNLGIDSRKSDQAVRSATTLPRGTGRTVRVAVFAQAAKANEAKAAGADIVGFDDLAETIKSGTMDFDILIATPDAMRLVGQLGQILGPRGLMPNPKVGTVTMDVAGAIRNAKSGQARYRTDKNGIIHCSIGRASFSPEDLQVNLEAVIVDLKKLKPSSSKGVYLQKITVSTTMGPGLVVDQTSLSTSA
jgi:large subunit ribosomal protein L1